MSKCETSRDSSVKERNESSNVLCTFVLDEVDASGISPELRRCHTFESSCADQTEAFHSYS